MISPFDVAPELWTRVRAAFLGGTDGGIEVSCLAPEEAVLAPEVLAAWADQPLAPRVSPVTRPYVEGVYCGHHRGLGADPRRPGGCGELLAFSRSRACLFCHRRFHDACHAAHTRRTADSRPVALRPHDRQAW